MNAKGKRVLQTSALFTFKPFIYYQQNGARQLIPAKHFVTIGELTWQKLAANGNSPGIFPGCFHLLFSI
jgi:hypothetical protein